MSKRLHLQRHSTPPLGGPPPLFHFGRLFEREFNTMLGCSFVVACGAKSFGILYKTFVLVFLRSRDLEHYFFHIKKIRFEVFNDFRR